MNTFLTWLLWLQDQGPQTPPPPPDKETVEALKLLDEFVRALLWNAAKSIELILKAVLGK